MRETFLWHGRERCTHPEGRLAADDPRHWKWVSAHVLPLTRWVRVQFERVTP